VFRSGSGGGAVNMEEWQLQLRELQHRKTGAHIFLLHGTQKRRNTFFMRFQIKVIFTVLYSSPMDDRKEWITRR